VCLILLMSVPILLTSVGWALGLVVTTQVMLLSHIDLLVVGMIQDLLCSY
jgi:hypothetical protein